MHGNAEVFLTRLESEGKANLQIICGSCAPLALNCLHLVFAMSTSIYLVRRLETITSP
jgi:hypothetical protein